MRDFYLQSAREIREDNAIRWHRVMMEFDAEYHRAFVRRLDDYRPIVLDKQNIPEKTLLRLIQDTADELGLKIGICDPMDWQKAPE